MQTIRLDTIHGAAYNPRFLSGDAFAMLKESITELGIIKPIIVRKENNTIVAGHQRTLAMKALGYTECPAYVIKGVSTTDEVRFNQIHNSAEKEIDERQPEVSITATLAVGQFQRVANKDIQIVDNGGCNTLKNQLSRMYLCYGEFGCPICSPDGRVVVSSIYAFAVKRAGGDMDVLCLPFDKAEKAVKYLSKQYGVFDYSMLKKTTWHQRFAQKKRLRNDENSVRNQRSYLYEKVVLPYLRGLHTKDVRILDFGAGQYDYAKMLKRQGWDIVAIDPYHQRMGSQDIDVDGNRAGFIRIAQDIQKNGLYDIVICDSVLNSVDSIEAQSAVVTSVHSLCKVGGRVFISGRSRRLEDKRDGSSIVASKASYIHFYDKNGFTALYRSGAWQYQKFDTDEEINGFASFFGSRNKIHFNSQAWEIEAIKDAHLDTEQAVAGLRFEWNLPLPGNKRYGLADIIENAYRNAISDNS